MLLVVNPLISERCLSYPIYSQATTLVLGIVCVFRSLGAIKLDPDILTLVRFGNIGSKHVMMPAILRRHIINIGKRFNPFEIYPTHAFDSRCKSHHCEQAIQSRQEPTASFLKCVRKLQTK